MPVNIRKVDGYRVSHGGKVSAKDTSLAKAYAQRRLLEGLRRGWKPTGKSAQKIKIKYANLRKK